MYTGQQDKETRITTTGNDQKGTDRMRKIARYPLGVFVLSALVWLTACEWTLSGAHKDAVIAFSEPATDNLFTGLNASHYAAFSRDFDSDMLKELPAADFEAWRMEMDSKIGNYLSRQVNRVTRSDEFYVVFYQAKFDREPQVKVTVAFHASDQSIAFLAFDSDPFTWSAFD
jgi:hypothetical protein